MNSTPGKTHRLLRWLGLICIFSFVLVLHNYGVNLFPRIVRTIDPSEMRSDPDGSALVVVYDFGASTPDGPYHRRSRTIFFENDSPQPLHNSAAVARAVGRFNWAHEPGRILFSSSDNSDPRVNGNRYGISYPLLYHPLIGRSALLLFALSIAGLYLVSCRRFVVPQPTLTAPTDRSWHGHFAAASFVFLAGLYLSTGTLAPYAATSIPYVDPANGYLYNTDHVHFRAMFDFVDGADRATWDNALFLRRILFNVLAYPFMIAAPDWAVGGTWAAIAINFAAFGYFIRRVRIEVGTRGAILAGWILAVYPGAGYWAGLPYSHALIFPGSLLLTLALHAIATKPGWRPVIIGSALLGLANLGYDFFVIFLPAVALLLVWQRRWLALFVSLVLQTLPLALWLLSLKYIFGQGMLNSNTGSFVAIAGSYFNVADSGRWQATLAAAPDIGVDVFFGANFIFLPAFFLAVVAANACTSRVRPHASEVVLLTAGALFFLFNNLAPDYESAWQMRGTWIARLYQPIFPAMILFCARWFDSLPSLPALPRWGVILTIAALTSANALVTFGPVLNNPLRIAETAFYRFYDHANPAMFEQNLRTHGRRPLGFPRSPD